MLLLFSHQVKSNSLWSHGLHPPSHPRVCSESYPLRQWCYLTISSSAPCFSFCLQSFPASGSFPISQVFTSGGQRIGPSASASVLPINIHDWLISFRTDWSYHLAIQGTLKSLLKHHNLKASILRCSAFFMVQLSHLYMTTGKATVLTIQNFVG